MVIIFMTMNVAVHGLKLEIGNLKLESRNLGEIKIEIGNLEEQYKSMKAKFLISTFRERLPMN